MLSLLSRPSVLSISYLAYEVFKNENKIVYVIKSNNDEKNFIKLPKSIDNMLVEVEDNTRNISLLLKERTKVVNKIETNLDFLRYAKINLNEKQVDSFASFVSYSGEQGLKLKQTLQKIESLKSLKNVKKELLHNDADYSLVYNELEQLNNYQFEAIACLNGIISAGENVLNIL